MKLIFVLWVNTKWTFCLNPGREIEEGREEASKVIVPISGIIGRAA